MAVTLGQAILRVQRRISDPGGRFFEPDEIAEHLRDGYRLLAHVTRCFWDQTYLENLPSGFSYTAEFEADYADFDYGRANITAEWQRDYFEPVYSATDPGFYTSPFEATDGHVPADGTCNIVPATSQMPVRTVAIDRPVWDESTIDAISHSDAEQIDSRYEVTRGEVLAIVAKGDGLRTVRKVRVPAGQADTHTVNGSWGIMRRVGDITGAAVSGTWGFPRRIPTAHPIGDSGGWGFPRRPYREGKNVRIEYFREGREVAQPLDTFELPDLYVKYVEHYALWKLYSRQGPAQDFKMAGHFNRRWQHGVDRLKFRVKIQQANRVGRLGGASTSVRQGPPRPKLPWQYGSRVR